MPIQNCCTEQQGVSIKMNNDFEQLLTEQDLVIERKIEIDTVKALKSASSAHKRIDELNVNVKSLEKSRHKHSGMLQNHQGILSTMVENINKLSDSVDKQSIATTQNTTALSGFKVMAWTIITMGGGFIGFIVYVSDKILKLW